jgi:uncharacterized protein (TIGR02271 family)
MKEAMPAPEAGPDASGPEQSGIVEGMVSVSVRGLDASVRSADGQVQVVEDEAVLRLLEEELSVERRRVESGRLRIHRATREVVHSVDEELSHEHHEVERVAVGRFVDQRPEVRETDDEIIIPVVEEVLVVERRLRLTEEIRIRKKQVLERHREDVVLRVQDASISRLPPRSSRDND